MSPLPSAEPVSASRNAPSSLSTTRAPRTLTIAFWGMDACALADALAHHAASQPGWAERLHISAHALPRDASPESLDTWIAAELAPMANKTAARPHLSLLVPAAGDAASTASEMRLRRALASADVSFQVLYGATTAECIRNAANAIALAAHAVLPTSESACFAMSDVARPMHPRMRAWACEKCSDPDCEHRLFTGLVVVG